MFMNLASLQNKKEWESAGIKLPLYDAAAMTLKQKHLPFGFISDAGNIFRGFVAALQQKLLDEGHADKGIIAAETFDYDIIDKIYAPYDNLTMNVILNSDATTSCEIIASVAEALKADPDNMDSMARLAEIFSDPGLQMVSFTITEKVILLRDRTAFLCPCLKPTLRTVPPAQDMP